MLIRNDDGTYIAGPLDALMILHHVGTGRYHAAFFEELALPGPIQDVDDVQIVRLRSNMHHTEGADTLTGACAHVDELKNKIDVHGNVFRTPVGWDGDPVIILLRPNWRRDPAWRAEDEVTHDELVTLYESYIAIKQPTPHQQSVLRDCRIAVGVLRAQKQAKIEALRRCAQAFRALKTQDSGLAAAQPREEA